MTRLFLGVVLALLLVSPAGAGANPAGTRPVQLIMPFPPGGPANAMLAALALAMSRQLDTDVEVINRGGLAGARGWLELAAAPPDGQTIGFLAMPAFLAHYADPSWETKFGPTDFTPVARVWAIPYGIAVPTNSSVRDLPGLIALAKAHPGEILVATGGRFFAEHILLAMIERFAGIRFDTAHFSLGSRVAAQALAGTHVDAMVANALNLSSGLVQGTARVLAVASAGSTSLLPGVPPMLDVGVPVVYEEYGMIAGPAGLPPDQIIRLEAAVRKALMDPEFLAVLRQNGAVPSFQDSDSILSQWPTYDAEVGAAILWMRQ